MSHFGCWSRPSAAIAGHFRSSISVSGAYAVPKRSMSDQKLFNPFAVEEEAPKASSCTFYSDPLAAFTRASPATAAARARATAAQQAAAAPNAPSQPPQHQQHLPGPRPPPVNVPPPQAGFSGYDNEQQRFSRGRGYKQYPQQQQQQQMGGIPYGGLPQTLASPPAVLGQQQWSPAQYNSPQDLRPQPGFTGQPPGHMTWQQQQQQQPVGAQGPGRGQGSGAYGDQQGGRGRAGRFNAGGRGPGGYNSYNNSGGYQQGGRGRGRSPKMPRLDTGSSSSSGGLPDGARFFKKSFLDDPWQPLMRQLHQQQQQQQQQEGDCAAT